MIIPKYLDTHVLDVALAELNRALGEPTGFIYEDMERTPPYGPICMECGRDCDIVEVDYHIGDETPTGFKTQNGSKGVSHCCKSIVRGYAHD
jgi:hypothetical protein